MTRSVNYIHKCSLPPTGRHIPGPREQGNAVAVSKQQASAYLTVLASLCFLIQCFRFATTEVRDYRAGSCGGWDKCRSTKLHFL